MKVPSKLIFLTGFMGVGKSYWGKTLSRKLQMKFIDLDTFIEDKEGRSIPQIIEEDGEAKFRKMESKWLKAAIKQSNAGIISLGGGTLLRGENITLVQKKGILIWLKKDSLAIKDLSEIDKRPLYESEDLESLYTARADGYSKAELTMDLDTFDNNKEIEKALIKYIRNSLNL